MHEAHAALQPCYAQKTDQRQVLQLVAVQEPQALPEEGELEESSPAEARPKTDKSFLSFLPPHLSHCGGATSALRTSASNT
jgi:hypothetical protein